MGRKVKRKANGTATEIVNTSCPTPTSSISNGFRGNRLARERQNDATCDNNPPATTSLNGTGVPVKRPRQKNKRAAQEEESFNERKDDQALLAIFPEELWGLVMTTMTDGDDFTNVCNSSPFFRRILYSRRTLMLFPKVWGVLGLKYETSNDESYCGYNLKYTDVDDLMAEKKYNRLSGGERVQFSHVTRNSHFHDILSMRLVCRTWNLAMDHFYQHFGAHYSMKHDPDTKNLVKEGAVVEIGYYGKRRPQGSWNVVTFYESAYNRMNELVEHFEPTHTGNENPDDRSPFIGRSVKFQTKVLGGHSCRRRHGGDRPSLEEQRRQYWADIINPLVKYGHHIWYCVICIEDTFPTRTEYYLKIKGLLELMPNLKAVSVVYTRTEREGYILLPHLPPNREEMAELRQAIATNPLPALNHLQFLSMRRVPNVLVAEILRRYNHIQMLETRESGNEYEHCTLHNNYISLKSLDNLTQLSLQIFQKKEFAQLESSRKRWRLNKLYLNFARCPYLPWPKIFKMLEANWGDTLTNLTLKLPNAGKEVWEGRVMAECAQYKLNLPHVKQFKVEMQNFSSVDFILPMKNTLEWLRVKFNVYLKETSKTKEGKLVQDNEKIKILGLSKGKMVMSNIWALFPKLNRVELDEQFKDMQYCTRNQWKIKMARMGSLRSMR